LSTPFLLTSHGWSASKWVAYALNLHPDITCGHSSAALLADDTAHQDDNLAPLIPGLRAGYTRRQSVALSEIYAALSAKAPARFTGTVHTYRLRDLPVQAQHFPPAPGIPVMNLVRHPLDLVVSGAGQFDTLFRTDLNELAWTVRKLVDLGLDLVETICKRHGLAPGGHAVLCFFSACVVLGSLRLDLDAEAHVRAGPWDYKGPVRMEAVTQDRAAFAALVHGLTGIEATPDYLDVVFAQSRINRHDRGPARDRWATLAPWQREAFAAFLSRFDLQAPYEAMGYEFRFLESVAAHG